ncbi:DUF3515 domain-containing protein [Psychromicrobium lacuslunae]|uniref:Secreted protein n=1 Tax=Psychromicrobium lacuslunae TaxID=1618207 RepID=A0A0D4BY33_9MICC|nr:DUF3515 domain-containing protein [Psychromicrobium lacuslunae]AJT41243.1 hypothetical protein UM93_06390 [Psychromicrobium lacuslunae]
MQRRPRTLALSLALLPIAAITLSSCTPAVEVSAAKDSANPACAPMMIALPDKVADAPLRETSSQATAAWGNPSVLILRCGVTPPPRTSTDQCVGVNGVDWLMKQDGDTWTLTTYGRIPATEILFNQKNVASSTVLPELAAAVGKIPQSYKCLSLADVPKPSASPSAK